MQIDDQAAFLAFAECLNFTQAAEVLSISQPALHVKINKLGKDLGVRLYHKQGRHLILTAQGEEFARFCRGSVAGYEALLRSLRGEESEASVTLAAGSGAFLYLLGPGIQRFQRLSRVALNLLTADRDQALRLLRSGEAQLACSVLSVVPSDIDTKLLCEQPTLLVVPKEHPLARRRSLGVKDLQGLSLVVPPAGRPFRETVEVFLKTHGIEWTVALEAQGWELMMHFVDLGMGCTLVNGCCRIPRNCRAIPVRGMPVVEYRLLRLKGSMKSDALLSLQACLLEASDSGSQKHGL